MDYKDIESPWGPILGVDYHYFGAGSPLFNQGLWIQSWHDHPISTKSWNKNNKKTTSQTTTTVQ